MKKLSGRAKLIILLSCITVLLTFGVAAFAYYFSHDDGQSASTTATITSDTEVEISSLSDFVEAGEDTEFNSEKKVSESSGRTILKLTADITLSDDVVLTKDCHISLNGHTLNLNDYSITYLHGYAGCFLVENGTIEAGENGNGKIYLNIPNATLKTNSMTYLKNDVSATETDIFVTVALNEKYTAYAAMYMATDKIASDLAERVPFKDYDEVNALENLTPDLFIPDKNCSLAGTNEACSIVSSNLDLIDHYLSTDVTISYISSDEEILTNEGQIKGYGSCLLTITVSKSGWTGKSVSFKLHVVDLTNATERNSVGISLLENYLSPYYVEGDLVIKESTVLEDYYYSFKHAIALPKTALGSITYTYKTTNAAGTDNANPRIALAANNANAYIFEPSTSDAHLVVTIDSTSTSLNMYSTYVGLEETVAYYIANYLYGGSIVYNKASTGETLVTLADINAATSGTQYYDLKTYIADYDVTAISYTLKSGSDAATDYTITDGTLKTAAGVTPADKETALTMSITIGSSVYDIDLNIEYLDSNGSTLASYITYYSIYNALVPSELETSFEMPFATNNIAPYTVYDVATYSTEKVGTGENSYTKITSTLYKPSNLKITLYYDGAAQYTFTSYTSQTSFSNQLDTFLTSKSLTLQALAAKTGTNRAYYIFSIDAQNSLNTDTNLIIIYNYKFDSSAETWTRYEKATGGEGELTDNNTSYLIVLGGLFYSTSGNNAAGTYCDYAVKDANFFIWIYNKFRPNVTGYADIEAATTDRIIPIDWLGQAAVITKDDTELSDVEDFNGIKYLSSVTEVDLSGGTVNDNILTGISEMKALKTLKLSGCSITDVSSLAKLSSQGTLKTLDISNNSIQYFDGITGITSLEKVYVYGNNATHAYYGSKGICNFQAFADLMRNGCAVYNDVSNDVPVLYAESDNIDDYKRLKEIGTVDKLKDGLDIRNLYKDFYSIKSSTAITIYFENTSGWTNVYYYTWNNSTGDEEMAWPGMGLPVYATDSSGYTVYRVTIDLALYDRVIFTNSLDGTDNKTNDLTLTSSTTGFNKLGGSYTYTGTGTDYIVITDKTGTARVNNPNAFGLQTAGIVTFGYEGDSYEGAKYISQDLATGTSLSGATYYEIKNGAYTATTDSEALEGKTYYLLATYSNATYYYAKMAYSSGYVMIVKFYVDRY